MNALPGSRVREVVSQPKNVASPECDCARRSTKASTPVTGETIFWRVRHPGADGRFSSFSRESSFGGGEPPLEAVPFDLSPHLSHDVIANPGDREDEAFDQIGYRLVAALPEGSPLEVQGLPIDGAVGVHRVAS